MPRPADPNAREALVACARAEFARKGLVGARIEDITAACGLSKGSFYLHFSSKEALFGELVERFLGVIARSDDRRERAMPELVADDLRILEHMWEYRDVMGVLLRGAQGTKFEGAIWEITDREIERIKQNFDRLQFEHTCRTDIAP